MAELQVKAERVNGPSGSVTWNTPDDVNGLVETYGSEIVYSHARRSIIIALQSYIRGMLDDGKSQEEIQTAVNEWKPGLRKVGKTPLERARDEISRMSPADRKALAKEIRERAN